MAATFLKQGMSGQIIRVLHQRLRQRDLSIATVEAESATFGPSTVEAVKKWQDRKQLHVTGIVDEPTAASLDIVLPDDGQHPPPPPPPPPPVEFPYLVRGQVLYKGGLPIPGLAVGAFHRDLRSETRLAPDAATDQDGNFEIYYNTDALRGPDGKPTDRPPDLFVRVTNNTEGANVGDKITIESPLRFAAPRVVKFRLQVDRGPSKTWSEYQELTRELAPLLGGLSLDALTQDSKNQDVTLLAGKLAQDPRRIAALVAAHKLAREVNGDPEVFYALARKDLPTNMAALLATPPGARSRALVAAIREGVVSGRLVGEVRKTRERFEQHAATFAAADVQTAGLARLGAVLKTAVSDQTTVDALVSRMVAHRGPTAKLWEAAAADEKLAPIVADAQLTLQLAALTGRHVPLVKALLKKHRAGDFKTIADLARFTRKDWLDLVNGPDVADAERFPPSIPGKDAAEKAEVYAATLARIVTDAMPTLVLGQAVLKDPAANDDAKTFWKNVTDGKGGFDLRLGNTRAYLEKTPELLAGVQDKEALYNHLGQTRRLYNLTTDYAEQGALRAGGLGSALDVARLGRDVFLNRMSGGAMSPQRGVLVFEKAARVTAATLDLLATFSPAFNLGVPWAIPVASAKTAADPEPGDPAIVPRAAVKTVPNLETLFGSFNLCGCDQCRSVLGPAAYFADVLAYLGDRTTAGGAALDALFRRRPDLGEIELTCANTNTVMPYTDLVNEILERRVAPFVPFDPPAAAEAELNNKTISDAVRSAFAAHGVPLAAEARVVVGANSGRWSITDGSTLYSIVKTADGAVRVTGAWPQTAATAAQLAAVPEHANPAAHQVLRGEVYPWILPFDPATEEVRVFLAHLGVQRRELMEDLAPGGSSAALDDVATAAEFLGLTDPERQYAVAAPLPPNAPRQPWEFWGLKETGNTIRVFDPVANDFADKQLGWLESLAQVRQVLQRSGLEYDQLVRVLGREFVNPGLAARIVSADPNDLATCDIARLTITNLTAPLVDRLVRFTRTWRRIGWDVEELDRVLVTLCGGALDDAAVVKLSHVARLRATFDLSVDEIVSFWAPIPTTGANPLYARLFQNPETLAPLDPAFALQGGELAVVAADPADARTSKHAAAILAALRISAADLAAMLSAGVADDALNLENLSNLHRHALFAARLELTVPELLTLKKLAGANPFDPGRTADAIRFADLAARVRQSGLGVADLAYLLFHQAPETTALAPLPGATAEMLAEVRRRLKPVRAETAPRPDPSGENLRRALAALRWPASMIDEVMSLVGTSPVVTAPLDPPPANFAPPAEFDGRLSHDAQARTLTLRGPLTDAERTTLKNAFPEANYKAAIDQLADQIGPLLAVRRTTAQTRMRAYEWPTVTVPLAALPADLTPANRARLNHDPAAQTLSFDGTMTAADKTALDAFSADPAYRAATAALLAAADAYAPPAENQFVTAAAATTIFDLPLAADRFERLLGMVLARRRVTDGTRLVVRLLADAVGLKPRLAERLLTRDLHHPTLAGKPAIDAFLDDAFGAGDPDNPPTEAAFPAPFAVASRLTKIAALIGRMSLSDRVIGWLGDYGDSVATRKAPWGGGAVEAKWLALTDLSSQAEPANPSRFFAWLRLANLSRIREGLQGGEATAAEMFAEVRKPGATTNGVMDRLEALTGWEAVELKALPLGLTLPGDLGDEYGLGRLRDAAIRLGRLGTTAAQAQAWAAAAPAADAGVAARRAVQAAYPPDQWPDAIRPLEDQLREKRRAALVGYLIARPDPARGENWTDANGMYSHLLIDVETDPVVLTSRLKQAIGSAQLFAQRCLLNLEPDVKTDDVGWRQWAWMKQYRVWEANRKIFLFPENWIEPELRDDKSPFFLELENTLLQADVTPETAEAAYATYLERLDEVARLEVAGVFHQPGEDGADDEFHVFARSQATPPAHHHRKWIGQARWTPWRRLDLDIPAGQILPLVWNRRLYLFWPLFTRKTDPPPSTSSQSNPIEGAPYFEIQLAWSEYRRGGWGPKKTTPPDRTIRSVIPFDGKSEAETRDKHVFRASIGGELCIWFESTEGTPGVVDKYGRLVAPPGVLRTKQGWRFTGCNGRIEFFNPYNVGVFPPPNTIASGMFYVESNTTDGALQLPKAPPPEVQADVVLKHTPGDGRFRLLSPHQEQYLTGSMPFFFHDDLETLFVVPREATEWVGGWRWPDRIDPSIIDLVDNVYYRPDPIPHPLDPVAGRWDPVPVIRHQYEAAAAAVPVMINARAEAAPRPTPIVPIQPTGALTRATEVRKRQVQSMIGGKDRALLAGGDRAIFTVNEFIDTNRLIAPAYLGHMARVRRYEFRMFHHPHVCPMIRDLNVGGIDGLLRRSVQLRSSAPFEGRYAPTGLVEKGDPVKKDRYPVQDVDFDFDGAYAGYNWELFLHVPLMIACKLSRNQRFEDAQRWFHAIFDPTDSSSDPSPAKFWRTRPFFEQADLARARIDRLLKALARGEPDPDLSRQLNEWVANPFQPFAVARTRTIAFQKLVVMKYLDNLIAWGDQLFRRDTIESINEATQLYVLAAELLGPRPPTLAPRATPETHAFNTLAPRFASLTNALTDIEAVVTSPTVDSVLTSPDAPPLPVPQLLYFCPPANDKLMKYWDTVADRLFKIRHSLNLAGVRRTPPLFEPPIDPMLLVKAAAAGVDLSTAIADFAAPDPLYRFSVLARKAVELCQDVKLLGQALLTALERRDAEDLARIQAEQQVSLLKRVTAVRDAQIKEAKAQIDALLAARELAANRHRHYLTLLGGSPVTPPEGTAPADAQPAPGAATLDKDGVRMIAQESNELNEMSNAADDEQAASNWDALANVGSLIPAFAGYVTPWGCGVQTAFGGEHIGPAFSAIANLNRSAAADHRNKSLKASRLAQFIMRAHDWSLEANQAAREIAHIDKQLAAARVREALATTERDNHLKQVEETERVEEHLRTKYTNKELYDWMTGQLSAVYFQAYQLAYDCARRAERAFRLELAVADTDFIRFGYWDSLRKGLLAGDRLLHDLRRMEVAYLDQNAREYEITKHVSLATLHPEALLALQERGACFVDLPEPIYDLDHPGHYLRRIKAVSVTVPCTTGPNTSVPLKLTLLGNRTRVDPRPTPKYAWAPDDPRFATSSGGIRSVVFSTGRDDPGAFEFNLADERYLPFEGAGAISSWRLELPATFRPFDYRTISDVVLRVRYTAREGGETLRDAATKKLADALRDMEVEQGRAGLVRGFSGRYEFPDAWRAFALMPDGQPGNPSLSPLLTTDGFAEFTRGRPVSIHRLLVVLVPRAGIAYDDDDRVTMTITPPTGAAVNVTLVAKPNVAGGLPAAEIALAPAVKAAPPAEPGAPAPTPWRMELTHLSANLARVAVVNGVDVSRVDPAKVVDVAIFCGYTI